MVAARNSITAERERRALEEETKSPGVRQLFDDGDDDLNSTVPVVNGGYINLENDLTLRQHEEGGYGLRNIRRVAKERDSRRFFK